jgi:arylsulfatase
MTDDQGYGDFSCHGNPVVKTPNLDKLHARSVRFVDFHSAPMCTPTRGQIMTGRDAVRNGATSVTGGRAFMRPGLLTLPQFLRMLGYRTGIFGKWHLGDNYPHRPMDRGFEEAVYHQGWGMTAAPEFLGKYIDGRYFHNGVEKPFKGYMTDLWFDKAMAWMKECHEKKEPFLCYLPTNAPHGPHVVPEKYSKLYKGQKAANFFGMIANIDENIARLDAFMQESGLAENTIVIFMTDNGGTSGVATFNAGLRAGKTTYYDGGHRVPCWIRWPNGKLGEPRDIDIPTQNTDLLPTLCDLCGVAPPKRSDADQRYSGISLEALLRGSEQKLPDRKFVVQYGQVPAKFEACVVWDKWRLVKGEELYDIRADRAQKENLAAAHADVVKSMRDYYEQWWKGLEPMLDDFVPISIGAAQQPVVELTSGDWEGIYADNSGYVREAVGGPTGGHWHILVEEAGDYEFTLRRWPAQTKAALGDKYEPSDRSPANQPKAKAKAKATTVGFPTIARAQLEIAGRRAAADAKPKDTGATIRVENLPAGKTTLKAWFSDAGGTDLCGAFFVTVARKK